MPNKNTTYERNPTIIKRQRGSGETKKKKKAKQKRWVTSLSLGEGPGNPCALCRAHTSAGLDISRWLGEKEGVIARPARTLPRGRARARAHLSLCACAPAAQQQQRNGRRVGESGRSLSDRAATAGGTNTHIPDLLRDARAPRGALVVVVSHRRRSTN